MQGRLIGYHKGKSLMINPVTYEVRGIINNEEHKLFIDKCMIGSWFRDGSKKMLEEINNKNFTCRKESRREGCHWIFTQKT